MKNSGGTLVISNLGFGDVTFDSDRGSWNVTRALADCLADKHGRPYTFEVSHVVLNTANVDVDEAKIARMLTDKHRLLSSPPLVFVEDDGKIWLIDGHHRVRAMQKLGYAEVAGYVIEAHNAKHYRILFNGERVAPWYRQSKER